MELIFGFITKLILFSIVIGFVAFIHELGHFLVAKWCKVRVDAFAIGMGSQKLWCKTWGETEYSIRIFPIGGFVLLAQEDGYDPDDTRPDPGERSFQAKAMWQKIAILLAGPFMNVLGTIGILFTILYFLGDYTSTMQVIKLVEDSPAFKSGIKVGDVIHSINGEVIQTYDGGRRAIAKSAGRGLDLEIDRRSQFREFKDYSMAMEYLQKKYEKGNFIKVHLPGRQLPVIFDRKDSALLFLQREGEFNGFRVEVSEKVERLPLSVTPDSTGKIGVHIERFILSDQLIRYPFMKSLGKATENTLHYTVFFFAQISRMFVDFVYKFKAPKEIGGPVAIANAVSQSVEHGLHSFLQLAAQICLSIGVFNLIPIPGLDGGRIFLIVVKDAVNWFTRNILGRAKETIDDAVEGYINIFGVLCVLSLIIIVTFKDIQEVLR